MKILISAYLIFPPILSAAALWNSAGVYGYGLLTDWAILTACIYFAVPLLLACLWAMVNVTATAQQIEDARTAREMGEHGIGTQLFGKDK